ARRTRRAMKKWFILFGLVGASACDSSFEPGNLVQGLRVLAISAEPPEVAPSAETALRALAACPSGAPIAGSWAARLLPMAAGKGAINPDCTRVAPAA